MILTIYISLFVADLFAGYATGSTRRKKLRYLLPCVGGWLALADKLKAQN
jgi:hypothetical protein